MTDNEYPDVYQFGVPYAVARGDDFTLHKRLGDAKNAINHAYNGGAIYKLHNGQWRKIYQYDKSHRLRYVSYTQPDGTARYRTGNIDWTFVNEDIKD